MVVTLYKNQGFNSPNHQSKLPSRGYLSDRNCNGKHQMLPLAVEPHVAESPSRLVTATWKGHIRAEHHLRSVRSRQSPETWNGPEKNHPTGGLLEGLVKCSNKHCLCLAQTSPRHSLATHLTGARRFWSPWRLLKSSSQKGCSISSCFSLSSLRLSSCRTFSHRACCSCSSSSSSVSSVSVPWPGLEPLQKVKLICCSCAH